MPPDPTTALNDGLNKMPSRTAYVDEMWSYLNTGVDHVMNSPEQLSFTGFTSLFTVAYNYCTSAKMHGLFYVGGNTGYLRWSNESNLYNKVSECLILHVKARLQKTNTLSDVDLLRYYAAEWDRYTTGAKCLNRIFALLNGNWVQRERNEGRNSVFPVYILALFQWKEHFLMHIQRDNTKLTTATVRLITAQRNGETIDQDLVKKVVDSFISLGLDITDPNRECLDIYEEHFETAFIHATELYYKKESETFLAQNSVSDYLKKAEERLREGENGVERYLHTKTWKELISRCGNNLIREHGELMWDSFQNFLDLDQDEDLERMYSLLSQTQEGLEPLRKRFEAHVKQAGLASIFKVVGEGGAIGESLNPKIYVDALLEVHQKNSEIVNRSFKGDVRFAASLDKACREFVNRNAATGLSSTKSPELIVKYVDMLLRKKNKMAEEADLDGALDRVMVLFNYLEGRDVFLAFYMTKLSNRLIHSVSASDESEATMIFKLKEACGFEYTNKLQSMLTDMRLSKDLTDSFNEHIARDHDDIDIAFSIMVLGTDSWPLIPPAQDFVIPPEILSTYDRFQKYYQTKHPGRKLTWLWNYSQNELHTNYLDQQYILMTSSYQMAVLLQYNENDTMSLDELVGATAIAKDILVQVLVVLVTAKVLINVETDQYDLNLNFKSKKIRVNLNLPIKAEVKAESNDVLKAVDEDRKYVVQATIIRIMKVRKTLKTQALIQEVISQISQPFTPKIRDIQKAIDALLEKEYMERVDGARDMFAYIA